MKNENRSTAAAFAVILIAVAFAALAACGQMSAGTQRAEQTAPAAVTGKFSSPSATTTIPGNRLPPPDPKSGGNSQQG